MKSFNFEVARNVTIYENRQFENQYFQASKILQPSNARYNAKKKRGPCLKPTRLVWKTLFISIKTNNYYYHLVWLENHMEITSFQELRHLKVKFPTPVPNPWHSLLNNIRIRNSKSNLCLSLRIFHNYVERTPNLSGLTTNGKIIYSCGWVK